MTENTLDNSMEMEQEFTTDQQSAGGDPVLPNTAPQTLLNGNDPFSKMFKQGLATSYQQSVVAPQQAKQKSRIEQVLNPDPVGGVSYYDPGSIDIYTAQKDFDPFAFEPGDPTNYQSYAEAETWGSALLKGWDSFKSNFVNARGEGWQSDFQLFTGQWDKLAGTPNELIESGYEEQLARNKNHVFSLPGDDGFLSKSNVSNFLGSAGFFLGTAEQMMEFMLIEAGITALTLGGATPATIGGAVAKLGSVGARFGLKAAAKEGVEQTVKQGAKSGFKFADMMKGYQQAAMSVDDFGRMAAKEKGIQAAGEIVTNPTIMRSTINEFSRIVGGNINKVIASKSAGELGMNILRGTPLLGTAVTTAEKIATGAKAGMNFSKLAGVGLQGAIRIGQEFNMASTEASFEAVSSYTDAMNTMLDDYKRGNNGQSPDIVTFEKMQENALKSSRANYATNVGILLATNKLQFGGLFDRYLPANKWASDFLKEGADNILTVTSKRAAKGLIAKEYKLGFLGAYGAVGQIAKDFGAKTAALEFGRATLKGMKRFSLTEGLQENLQEVSSIGWRDYYVSKMENSSRTVSQAMGKGFEEQFTKQGLNTFLSGALTGIIFGPIASGGYKAVNKVQNAVVGMEYKNNPEQNPIKIAEKQIQEGISLRNALYKQMSDKKLDGVVFNLTAQVDAANRMTDAAKKGKQYEFENARTNSILAGAVSANSANTIDAYLTAIKTMGETMSSEDFEKAFGIKLEDTKYSSPKQFAESVARDVKKYSDTVDALRRKFKNISGPITAKEGTREYISQVLLRNAQEEAVKILALNVLKSQDAAERAKKVSSDFASLPEIGSSSEYAMRVLTNPQMLQAEKGNILAEMKIIEDSLEDDAVSADAKKELKLQLKDKAEELELLEKWTSYWTTRKRMMKSYDEAGNEIEEETGETELLEFDPKSAVFKGKEINQNQEVVDENGEAIEEVDTTYDIYDKEIADTFRLLMNIKNKQAGNDTQISEQTVQEGYQKIIDYIRLDRDARDYITAADSLFNEKNFEQTVANIADGNFKARLLFIVNNIETVIKINKAQIIFNAKIEDAAKIKELTEEFESAIRESEAFKNLLSLVSNPAIGISNSQYVTKQLDEIDKILALKAIEMMDKSMPELYKEGISKEDVARFKSEGKITPFVKLVLAKKIALGQELSEDELEIKNKFADELSELAKTLEQTNPQNASEQKTEAEVVTNETGKAKEDDEFVTIEMYNEFIDTGNVSEEIVQHIGNKIRDNKALTQREQSIYQANSGAIESFIRATSTTNEGHQFVLGKFKNDYEKGLLAPRKIGGSRNIGVFQYDGFTIKVVKSKRKLSEDNVALIDERLGDMDNVYYPLAVVDMNNGQSQAILMKTAKGVDASTLTQQQIDAIPDEHWARFETDLMMLDQRGVQVDLTKRNNLFYDAQSGFGFIDIEAVSIANEPSGKFVEIDGKLMYYAYERYRFFPIEYKGPKALFEYIESKNQPQQGAPVNTENVENNTEEDTDGFSIEDLGIPLPQKSATSREDGDPFVPQGNDQSGYSVVDRNNEPVNNEVIESATEAQELAESLNTNRSDVDFAISFLGEELSEKEPQLIVELADRARASLKRYNSRNKTDIKTLDEYFKLADGRRLLEQIKDSVITGKPVKYKKNNKSQVTNTEVEQMSLFDTTASVNATGLNVQDLIDFANEFREFKLNALQNTEKFSKFVEGGILSEEISEQSILDELKDIHKCI